MVCFVQIPQQSYLKVFQNVMFIVFCTGIYMEMNNLRVGELRCYILKQKDPGSNPRAVSIKLGNSKTHMKNNCLFEIKKFLMQIIILWKILHHQETLPPRFILPSVNTKYPGGINCFSIHSNLVPSS